MSYTSIGLDLDGVLYDYYSLIRQYFKSLPEECETLGTANILDLDERRSYYDFTKSPYMIQALEMYPGAWDFLKWVSSSFDTLYIVTARQKETADATKKQIKE